MAPTAPKPPDSQKPRRGRKGSNAAPTEEAFRGQLVVSNDYLKAAEEIREALNTAMGRYRSSRKTANTIGEGLGYKPSTIDYLFKAIRRDQDEVAEEATQRERILAFWRLPGGAQPSMFDDPSLASEFAEDSPEDRAYMAGAQAHVNGIPRDNCPATELGPHLSECWEIGWDRSSARQTQSALDQANAPRAADAAPAAA